MQRRPLQPLWFSSASDRRRYQRSLVLFSFFPSSMETTSLSSSIDAAGASSAAADPGKEILFTSSVSESFGEGKSSKEFGFSRSEFGRDSLVGTVQLYDRHVFLRYKSPEFWLPNVEAPDSDRVPRLLAAAMKARKDDMKKKVRSFFGLKCMLNVELRCCLLLWNFDEIPVLCNAILRVVLQQVGFIKKL